MTFIYEHLLPPTWKKHIILWLEEDIPSFDVGGFVVGDSINFAYLYGKSNGILAGVPFFNAIFEELKCSIEWFIEEGEKIIPSKNHLNNKIIVAKVTGKCRNILLGERIALNIITRASGIATQANELISIVKNESWNGKIAGTRKTTPGFRLVEKYALLIAGADTHRYDLSQMVMLKDNHIWSAGNITNAIKKAKSAAGFSMKIEVECRNLQEAMEAAKAGADIVMLDNFNPILLNETAKELKEKFPFLYIEASGGITKESIKEFLSPYIDIISLGILSQGYPCLDFSLKIQKKDEALETK